MKLELKRIAKQTGYTIGKLYVDGDYFCDTLEDEDRGLMQDMSLKQIERIKIPGKTAIPEGTYEVTMDVVSPKYSQRKVYDFCEGKLPRLLNVPGYEGILIHIGNYPKDTDGCILVGKNTAKGAVMESTGTFWKLYDLMKSAKEPITIKIF